MCVVFEEESVYELCVVVVACFVMWIPLNGKGEACGGLQDGVICNVCEDAAEGSLRVGVSLHDSYVPCKVIRRFIWHLLI